MKRRGSLKRGLGAKAEALAAFGTQLSTHPDVDMISFTGSTRAGVAISKAAADSLKRVSLELGGKGANIVFADAPEKAVRNGVLHCMNNSGQSCNAPTRMLVERSYYPEALDIAKATAAAPAKTDISSARASATPRIAAWAVASPK